MDLLQKYKIKAFKERKGFEILDFKKSKSNNYKLLVKNTETNEIDWTDYSTFFIDKKNPRSMGDKKEIDKEEFIKRLENKYGKGLYIVHEFNSFSTNCLLTCTKCNRTYSYIARNFLNRGCGKCKKDANTKKRTKSNEIFLKEVFEEVGNDYTFLEPYKSAHVKLKIRHNVCGKEYEISPHTFLNTKVRCADCASSKGEAEIRRYLKLKNISYDTEYQFSNCKSERNLRFDFAIFDKNNNMYCLIEYQGKQHYEAREFGGINKEIAIIEFENTKKRDKIKKEYCVANNIKLIEIPYWEFKNIKNIIDKIYSELYGDI